MIALSSAIQYWARVQPERLALAYGQTRITYAQLAGRMRAVAGVLQAEGIVRGDIVALLMKNSAAFIELVLAAGYLGAVVLPINYRLSAEEVGYIVGHSGAKLVCVDEELQDNVAGQVKKLAVRAAHQHDASLINPAAAPVAEEYPSLPSDMFRLMYTSGTTDRPKGVVHTYDNFYWKTYDHICVLGLTSDTRILVVGPLYHVGAFDLPGFAVLQVGGSMHVLRDFEPEPVLRLIQDEKLTCAWFAPVMLNRLLSFKERDNFDVSSLQWVIGGGERTPAERIHSFKSLFKNGRYIDGYGLTETCSGDVLMTPGMEIAKIGSAGYPLAHVRVEIRDGLGNAQAANQVGEICLRGPKVTRGYWKDPERTKASFFGDWFRTGDMGYLDEDGYLFLVDRKKDMVISGGENIASSEVERVIYQLEVVEEAAVIGLPDERWGERVVAVVVPREGQTLTLEELQQHCRGKIGGFKIPKQLIVTEALPRNPSGKVLKRILREQLVNEGSN